MADEEVTIIDSGINDYGDYFEECSDGSVKIYEYDGRVKADYLSYEKTSEGEEFWYYAPLDSQKAKAVKTEKLKDGTRHKYDINGTLEYEYIPNKYKRWYSHGKIKKEITADDHETEWDVHPDGKRIKRFEYIQQGTEATFLEWNDGGKLIKGELADGTKLKGEYFLKGRRYVKQVERHVHNPRHQGDFYRIPDETIEPIELKNEKDCKYVLSVTYPDGRKLKAIYSLSGKLIDCHFYDKHGNILGYNIKDLAQKHIETEMQTEAKIEQKNGRKHVINPTRSKKPLKNLGMKIKKIYELIEIACQKEDDLKEGKLESEQMTIDIVQNKASGRQ